LLNAVVILIQIINALAGNALAGNAPDELYSVSDERYLTKKEGLESNRLF
jgi:hypothetical protein